MSGSNTFYRIANSLIMRKVMRMNTIMVSVAEGRSTLCKLIKEVKKGANVILTNHGKPEVVITAYRATGKPWRVAKPTGQKRFGDLQSPVMED
jgi:prevent-host-death family protein